MGSGMSQRDHQAGEHGCSRCLSRPALLLQGAGDRAAAGGDQILGAQKGDADGGADGAAAVGIPVKALANGVLAGSTNSLASGAQQGMAPQPLRLCLSPASALSESGTKGSVQQALGT